MPKSFRYTGPVNALYVRDYSTGENVLLEKGQTLSTDSVWLQKALAEHPDVEEVKAEAKPEKAAPRANAKP